MTSIPQAPATVQPSPCPSWCDEHSAAGDPDPDGTRHTAHIASGERWDVEADQYIGRGGDADAAQVYAEVRTEYLTCADARALAKALTAAADLLEAGTQ